MTRRLLVLTFALLMALPAMAQWTNQKKEKGRDPNIRNLQGVVLMPSGQSARGAIVKLKNLKTLQVTSFITPEDGKYKFNNLSTNIEYEVHANFNDLASDTRSLSVFDSRLDAIINLQLETQKERSEKEKEKTQ